jgi:tetratricopeptide (TPR) repeat protein
VLFRSIFAAVYSSIAVVYDNDGKYSEALEWYKKALDVCESTLGRDHSTTVTAYINISSVHFRKGEYPKAMEWLRKALAVKEKQLGSEHPETAAIYGNIALVLRKIGETDKALEVFLYVLDVFSGVFDPYDSRIGDLLTEISGIYQEQRNYEKAFEYMKRLAEISASEKQKKLS